MNTPTWPRGRGQGAALLVGIAFLGLWPGPTRPAAVQAPRRTALGRNLFFEVEGTSRRVIVRALVCLRQGQLEGLLCRKGTKEHEYILAADVDARQVHAALIAAGAVPGSPVQFAPRYRPARGTVIKVRLRYRKEGGEVTVAAQHWVREARARRDLGEEWVFGGSRFVPHPEDHTLPPVYLANQGDVICLCNMESAMLDLPVRSPKKFDERIFEAATERIPPLETPVDVILEPVRK
jgi:hypothetical protein